MQISEFASYLLKQASETNREAFIKEKDSFFHIEEFSFSTDADLSVNNGLYPKDLMLAWPKSCTNFCVSVITNQISKKAGHTIPKHSLSTIDKSCKTIETSVRSFLAGQKKNWLKDPDSFLLLFTQHLRILINQVLNDCNTQLGRDFKHFKIGKEEVSNMITWLLIDFIMQFKSANWLKPIDMEIARPIKENKVKLDFHFYNDEKVAG